MSRKKIEGNKPKKEENVYRISRSVSLPVNPNPPKDFVPADLPFIGALKLLEQMGVAIAMRQPVLIVGETGSGKTSAVRHLAVKTKNGFRRLNLNGQTGTDELVGKILLNKEGTYWVDGVLTDALRNGYWLLLDEINAATPEVLFVLHSLLDDDGYIVVAEGEQGGEVVRPHPNFRLFATMNPAADYAGTKEMNKAFLSRFFVLRTDFPPAELEASILVARTGVRRGVAGEIVKAGNKIREMKKGEKIDFVLSTRELLQWAQLYRVYGKFLPAAEPSILNKMASHEVSSVTTLLGLQFRGKDKVKTGEASGEPQVGDTVKLVSGN